jgi:hypothetical protein
MNNSQIDNVKLEPQPNSTTNDGLTSVRPSIAKPNVSCCTGYFSKRLKNNIMSKQENNLITGQKVYFKNEKLPYEVMAISKRYAVCSRMLNIKEDNGLIKHRVEMGAYLSFMIAYKHLREDAVYCICDFQKSIRSPNNLVFNSYDYFKKIDCLQTIIALLDGTMELSKRNKADLEIDFIKTQN